MNEAELARVLWVRAVEECDSERTVLRGRVRERATLQAREAAGGSDEAFVMQRASLLREALGEAKPALAGPDAALTWTPGAALCSAVGFALGLGAETLGSSRSVNLLAVPLVGIVAWNLGFYAIAAARLLLARRSRRRAGSRPIAAWLRTAFGRLRLSRATSALGASARLGSKTALRFVELWSAHGARPGGLRLRARLHLAAAAFGLGVIGGLYLAGFSFAYRATWESTFLEAEGAARFLGWLLAPGSALLGLAAPTASELAAIAAPADGPAALWIHRWSASLLCLVCLPRLALAGAASIAAARAARTLTPPFDDAYFVRLLAERARSGRRVELLPYSTQLGPRMSRVVRELAVELFGSRVDFVVQDPIPYGAPAPGRGGGDAGDAETGLEATLLVFNLAQTPEIEVHGDFLEDLRAARRGALLVLLDEERYAATAEPARVEERVRAWQRTVREAGCEALGLAGDDALGDDVVAAAARQLAAAAGRASATDGGAPS